MGYKTFGERYHIASATMLLDFALVLFSSYLALVFSEKYLGHIDLPFTYDFQDYFILALMVASLVTFLSMIGGVYVSWRGRHFFQQINNLLIIWLCTTLILLSYLFFAKISTEYSRLWISVWLFFGFLNSVLMRFIAHLALCRIRMSGVNVKHIVVVGCPNACDQVSNSLDLQTQHGFNIKKVFHIDSQISTSKLDDIANYLEEDECKELWICLPLSMGQHVHEIMHHLRHSPVSIRYVPDWSGFQLINHDVVQIDNFYMFNLNCSPMLSNTAQRLKDLEDKILGALILAFFSPLLLLIALIIKMTSPGPIFYRQERMGWNGKIFTMYKFRTMPVDAESKTGPIWSTRSDQRATPFGGFLRKTSLDELPQFFNVLLGDMSIVGPRPERKVFVDQYKDSVPGYMKKHLVKAGMTGWAQVNGWRGNTSLKKRIEYDLYYIENWSVFLDIKIIFLTVFSGFVHRNAY